MRVEASIERARSRSLYHTPETDEQQDPKKLVGKRIALAGLQSRNDLNGQAGFARAFNRATGRYAVELDSRGGERMAVKPANLTPLEPAPVD